MTDRISDPTTDFELRNFRSTGNPVRATVELPLAGGVGEVECTVEDGAYLLEGDILVRPYMPNPANKVGDVVQGHGVESEMYLWNEGVVPCVVQSEIRNMVTDAFSYWMSKTPFRFIPRTAEQDYVRFLSKDRNASTVGKQGGAQEVWIVPNTSIGWIVHEIGHVLGLWHEHSRSDRDAHIRVLTENIEPGREFEFQQIVNNADLIGNYDFDSIMHYPETAFANHGTKTIVRRDGSPIGPRNGLSAGDLRTCRELYSDLSWSAA